MKQNTLCLIIDKDKDRILFGMKKRGFGEGKINGFGGKIEESDESIYHAAAREVSEECNLNIHTDYIVKYGEIDFYFPYKEDWNQKVHIFIAYQWEGEPKESEEMSTVWYRLKDIPFENMWDTDKNWMPYILNNKKIKATFHFKEDNNTTDRFNIEEVESFD
ncbi:MAG: 8-oxo-dGTP diphosphatase [Nanoarchaeota archaeon]|jgi:8-oxo-dGTP diphosphatase|nr:8-oxo-dGTP diphosphatase [Nanoarchaeota archaeon]